jgi:pyridoxine 4-dehydrogenase
MENTLGGTFTFAKSSLTVNRVGYGAMQLAGPHVWGPPRDEAGALAVLREAAKLGINHIDTSDFYGPHVTNQLIKKALHPYPKGLVIVTKVGFLRGKDASWYPAASAADLEAAVHSNLNNLGLQALDIVNLRLGSAAGPNENSLREPLTALAALQKKGLVREIGLSNISRKQFEESRSLARVVCVQNQYNLAHRKDDALIDELAREGIAYVPFFPLGGFSPLQSSALDKAAAALKATPMQVALAWLLQRSPNILLIPGTSSVDHLRENLKAATLQIPGATLKELDAIAS